MRLPAGAAPFQLVIDHENRYLYVSDKNNYAASGPATGRIYVIDIDPETSRVIVGDAEDLIVEEFEIDNTIWHGNTDQPFEAIVKIRYAHPGAAATIFPGEKGAARVRLHAPQRAITPGQAAVCYRDDEVLGGGWICRHHAAAPAASVEKLA